MPCIFSVLTNLSLLNSPAVVHGQGESRGAVAQQINLAAAGETHGKSGALKKKLKYSVFQGVFKIMLCIIFFLFCFVEATYLGVLF